MRAFSSIYQKIMEFGWRVTQYSGSQERIYNLGRFEMCSQLTANSVTVVLFEIHLHRTTIKTRHKYTD